MNIRECVECNQYGYVEALGFCPDCNPLTNMRIKSMKCKLTRYSIDINLNDIRDLLTTPDANQPIYNIQGDMTVEQDLPNNKQNINSEITILLNKLNYLTIESARDNDAIVYDIYDTLKEQEYNTITKIQNPEILEIVYSVDIPESLDFDISKIQKSTTTTYNYKKMINSYIIKYDDLTGVAHVDMGDDTILIAGCNNQTDSKKVLKRLLQSM